MASKTRNSKGYQKSQGINNPPRQRLYDLKSAAVYLGRPVYSVRELVWSGKLPVIQDGRKQYVDVFDMNDYIERNKEKMI